MSNENTNPSGTSENFKVLSSWYDKTTSYRLVRIEPKKFVIQWNYKWGPNSNLDCWIPLKDLDDLTFKEFTALNSKRLKEYSDKGDTVKYKLSYWGCCLAGEVGEACNLIKKLEDGKDVKIEDIGKELADVDTYLDILYTKLGLDRVKTLKGKFNEVSDRYKCPIKL